MQRSILIIDDDARLATAMLTRLRAAGFNVSHANRGLLGIDFASMTQPDVIILDIRMPDIDGFETCRRMRLIPSHTDTPILFLSANADASSIKSATDAGGSEFIAKPYEFDELLKTIYRLTDTVAPAQATHTNRSHQTNCEEITYCDDIANGKDTTMNSMHKVLIADDDVRLLKALTVRLKAEGYEVLTCQDSYMATDLARRTSPDVILLDMNMPAGGGHTTHKRLLSITETKDTPIIYLTGDTSQSINDHADELGAFAIVYKPIEINELLAYIRSTLGTGSADTHSADVA